MADLELTENSYGFSIDFAVKNKDGTTPTLITDGYTAGTITIKTQDNLTVKLTKAVTIPNETTVRLALASGDVNFNGAFLGQIKITGSGKEDRTFLFTVAVEKKLD